MDEEEALGWSVIETGEGSDAGDGEEGFGRADGVRSLPAEMRYFDRAKIYVKAGDGGMGSTAFRREAQVSMGGPSGGNGGDGGAVWIVGDAARNSLLSFRKTVHFRASNGQNGEGKNCYGAWRAGAARALFATHFSPNAPFCRPPRRRRDYPGAAWHAGEGRRDGQAAC